MANLWFVSDTHFRHANILTFKRSDGSFVRPGFVDCVDMDETMIERWNSVVKPPDHVYHLGDVSMMRPRFVRNQLNRLNGHKRLIRGNHDIYKTKEYLEFFDEIYGMRVLDNIIFTHIPIHPASLGRFAANVHGHTHANPDLDNHSRKKEDGTITQVPYINVSVEQINYTPVSLEWIKARIKTLQAASSNSERLLPTCRFSEQALVPVLEAT